MIEAAKIWNEPNNKSHWDPNLDPEWDLFSRMARLTGQAIGAESPGMVKNQKRKNNKFGEKRSNKADR